MSSLRWKNLFIIGTTAIALLAAASLLVLRTLDFNRFKPRIIQAVREATGFELEMQGNIEFALGLTPRLVIHDVAIRNAPWGSRPNMVTMSRCEASVALLRLIRGNLEIDRLIFVEPDVLLETDASGALNFLSMAKDPPFPRLQEAAPRRAQFLPVRSLTLEKGRFTYRDEGRGINFVKSVEKLTIKAPTMKSLIQVTMTGSLNNRPLALEGNLGTPAGLVQPQQDWPVDLTIRVEGTTARLWGTLPHGARFGDLSLRIHAEGSSVGEIFALAGAPILLDPGPFEFRATLTGPGYGPALQGVDLRIGDRKTAEITVEGAVENLSTLQGIHLHVVALIKDPSSLLKDASKPSPLAGPLTIEGSLHDSAPKTLSVHNLRIDGGKDSLTGFLDIDRSGRTGRARLELSTSQLELQEILAPHLARGTLTRFLREIGPASLILSMAGPFSRASLEEVDLRLGKPENAEVRISGRIKEVTALQGIGLSFSAQGKDAADLENIFIKPLPVRGPYAVSGYVTDGPGPVLVCDDLKVTLGNNAISGSLELHQAGDKPRLDGAFSTQKLDLESVVTGESKNRVIMKAVHALGPINLTASLIDPLGKPGLSGIKARIGTNELAEVIFEGRAEDVFSRQGLDLHFAVQGKEFSRIQQIFGKPLPVQGAFSLTGRVLDAEGGSYRLEELDALLGNNAFRGWVEATALDPIQVQARFLSQEVDPDVLGMTGGAGAELLRPIRSWVLETSVVSFADRVAVESFQLSLEAPQVATAVLAGTVRDLFRWQGLDLTFALEGDDLAGVMGVTRSAFPLSGPFSLSGRLPAPKADFYEVRTLNAVLGENILEGTVVLDLSKQRPHLAADLSSPKLDLRPLFPKAEANPEGKDKPARSKKPNARVFPDDPLPLDRIQAVDAEITLEAAQILLPHLALENATVHARIDNGRLEIRPLQGAIGGGTADGHFTLVVGDGTPEATMEFKASTVDLGAMLDGLGVPKSVEGILRTELRAKAHGESIAEFMAALDGEAVFVIADGRIYNKYIDLLGGGLFREVYRLVNPLSQKEPFSELTCHVNRFEIKEGLASSKIWVTDTKYTAVRGGGEINLEKENIDLVFRMSPKKSLGIRGLAEIDLNLGDFARSFKVRGTFAQPDVTLDPAGAAATIGKMLGGLALFGPIGLAAGIIDLKLGQDHPCLEVLEEMEKEIGAADEQNKGATPSQTPEQQQGP
jgi:uncharacterized protein involved in outer membrane biogenesis